MILPATIRDATYVTAHLCPDDLIEAECQYRDFSTAGLGVTLASADYAYIATHKGIPAMIFGAHPICASTVSAWAVGTGKARVVPAVTRFCLGPLQRQLVADGYRWAEARSVASHAVAHAWLEGMGAEAVCDLGAYGKRGENFTLFRRPLSV